MSRKHFSSYFLSHTRKEVEYFLCFFLSSLCVCFFVFFLAKIVYFCFVFLNSLCSSYFTFVLVISLLSLSFFIHFLQTYFQSIHNAVKILNTSSQYKTNVFLWICKVPKYFIFREARAKEV